MRLRVVLAAVAALALPAAAGAQANCETVNDPAKDSRVTSYKLPSGERNTFAGGGITIRCRSRGITLVSDSVEMYGDEGRIFMLGNVRYSEPRLRVNSDYMTYFGIDERVVAAGNVVARLPSGSTLVGPQAEYRRASTRIRPVAELYSFGRPTVTILQEPGRNGARAPRRTQGRDTTRVTANVLFMRGDSLLYASGAVDIARADFGAKGDSVFMNTGTQYMRIMRGPVIEGRKGRPFTLKGDLIDLFSRQRALDRVLSQGNANAVSEDLTLVSDTIDLRVADDLLQAAHAWGRAKPAVAESKAQRLTADSIHVAMPAQRVRTMTALGKAYAEATPDTARFRTDDKDWLRGDTIIARFDTTRVAGDTATARVRELIAKGQARSYQHLPPQDSTERRPAVNYLRADSIYAYFSAGHIDSLRAACPTATCPGVYVEPTDTTAARRSVPPGSAAPAITRPGSDLPSQAPPRSTSPVALPGRPRPQPSSP